jgi:hypothetical protein
MNMIGGIAGGLGVLFAGQWKDAFGRDGVMLAAAAAVVAGGLTVIAVGRVQVASDRARGGLADPLTVTGNTGIMGEP